MDKGGLFTVVLSYLSVIVSAAMAFLEIIFLLKNFRRKAEESKHSFIMIELVVGVVGLFMSGLSVLLFKLFFALLCLLSKGNLMKLTWVLATIYSIYVAVNAFMLTMV